MSAPIHVEKDTKKRSVEENARPPALHITLHSDFHRKPQPVILTWTVYSLSLSLVVNIGEIDVFVRKDLVSVRSHAS
jgi:hypothetical protein